MTDKGVGSSPDAEIAIIGGGPAGSSTALFLLKHLPALRGRIHLFEKHRHPREKRCGGALSAWGCDHLRALDLADRIQGIPIDAFAVRMAGRVQRASRPGLARVVRRSLFDATLFSAAVERGAMGRVACPVTALRREEGLWHLETSEGVTTARVIVGADGASGGVRRMLGLREARSKAHLVLAETTGPEHRDAVARGTLLFDLTPLLSGVAGYYWDFPSPLDGIAGTSRGIFHLHAGNRSRPADVNGALDAAIVERGVDAATVQKKPWSIRPYAPGVTVSVSHALLAGEAVGVDPVTGEGIAHALEYGRLAADAIVRGLATGDLSFSSWHRDIEDSFVGRHLRQACRMAPTVYGPHGARWAHTLAASPLLVRRALDWYGGRSIGLPDLALFGAHVAFRALSSGMS